MNAAIVLVLGLGGPGLLPALAVARRSPALIFLAPLVGAVMAAVAAEIELAIGGSLLRCYVAVAVAVNLAVGVWWLAAGRHRPWPSPPLGWSVITLVVMIVALALPLSAIRLPTIGRDANSIWLTHSLMLSGGHHALVAGLKNPAYFFDNPDYPPLVPAAGALALILFGVGNLHIAIQMTELLTACALGTVGCLVATAGRLGSLLTRGSAIAAGGALCIVGFAITGKFAISGYTDLLLGAVAVAAVISGLVLPRGTQALVLAWTCATAASLTKNEGLTTSLVILTLIALRYRPLSLPRFMRPASDSQARAARGVTARELALRWAERGAFVVVPALPGLVSAELARRLGLQNIFFITAPPYESHGQRAGATIAAMASHLAVAPVAFGVLIIGCLVLRADRRRGDFANPAWLWLACLGALVIIFATYVFGTLEINVWLANSVNRTTVFAQLLLYAELAIWLVIAVDAITGYHDSGQHRLDSAPGLPNLAGSDRALILRDEKAGHRRGRAQVASGG